MRKLMLAVTIFLFHYAGVCQKNKLRIGVDERVELITVIQMICNSGVMTLTNADINYVNEVNEYFEPYKQHPAVAIFDSIYYQYFNFEMPFQLILHYSLPGFSIKDPIAATEFSPTRHFDKHKDSLFLFIRQLKDFYVRSGFHRFFTSHRKFYDSLAHDINQTLENKNIIPAMEAYYGKSFASYNLDLSPLSLDGGFGITVNNKKGPSVHAILGPAWTSKKYPDFKKSQTIVIHELSHSFSNPVIDSCWDVLKGDTCLYKPIVKAMQKEGYWGWMAVMYETLNRANEVVLTKQLFGEAMGEQLYNDYIGKKYIYLPICMAVLENYRTNRNRYRSIADIKFMLIEAFEGESREKCEKGE